MGYQLRWICRVSAREWRTMNLRTYFGVVPNLRFPRMLTLQYLTLFRRYQDAEYLQCFFSGVFNTDFFKWKRICWGCDPYWHGDRGCYKHLKQRRGHSNGQLMSQRVKFETKSRPVLDFTGNLMWFMIRERDCLGRKLLGLAR